MWCTTEDISEDPQNILAYTAAVTEQGRTRRGIIKLGKGKIKNTSPPEMQHEESVRATSARATTSTRAVNFHTTTEVMKMMTTGELTNSIIMLYKQHSNRVSTQNPHFGF